MKDWLGNDLAVGDFVVYSSKSTLLGMNLCQVVGFPKPGTIQLQLLAITRRASGATYMPDRKITLHEGTSAYKSVTRYSENIPVKETE
jgi:hypothetical protein